MDTQMWVFIGIVVVAVAYMYFYDPGWEQDIPLAIIFLFAGIVFGGVFA